MNESAWSTRTVRNVHSTAGQARQLAEAQTRGGTQPHKSMEPRVDGVGDAFDVFPVERRAFDGSLDCGALDVYRVRSE